MLLTSKHYSQLAGADRSIKTQVQILEDKLNAVKRRVLELEIQNAATPMYRKEVSINSGGVSINREGISTVEAIDAILVHLDIRLRAKNEGKQIEVLPLFGRKMEDKNE